MLEGRRGMTRALLRIELGHLQASVNVDLSDQMKRGQPISDVGSSPAFNASLKDQYRGRR
jgi:hypothetical protein